jgi:hypothetical protein
MDMAKYPIDHEGGLGKMALFIFVAMVLLVVLGLCNG